MTLEAPITNPGTPATPPTPTTLAPVLPVSPVVQAPAVPAVSFTTTSSTTAINEDRVRHFQSEADKARQELERRNAEYEAAQKDLQAMRIMNSSILEDTRKATETMLRQVEELKAARERDQAEAAKGRLLLEEEYRALAPYAGFVQATTDEAKLREQLTALKAAREKDLAAHAAQTPANTPSSTPPTPPSFSSQPMQPARPNPQPSTGSNSSVTEQIAQMMQAARAKLEANQWTIVEYEQEMQKVRDLANVEARRQMGISTN